jgi:hypothetical protein
MQCKICNIEFTPSKYHPGQQVCKSFECQKSRQLTNQRAWRGKNPDYFKSLGQEKALKEKRLEYNRLWKSMNKDYLDKYGQSHKDQRREYMREYMRRYRSL